ncbi:hypothetical protein Ddye_014330 [Dipteronia dyeriana]|uniref:protein-disulfide reductase n=1 Tax=Dipteronia dyeriana TaxID=168575 RepID=A0AAE0CKH9_9ROSI|nr:hypothetical protein Ddye_014330 [Dipteronia dyeriana]
MVMVLSIEVFFKIRGQFDHFVGNEIEEAAKQRRAVGILREERGCQGLVFSKATLGSIKTLVYNPSVRNKKATFALVCQTLKHLPIIKDVLEAANILNSKWKRQLELVYIIIYDILFGKEISLAGDAEKFLTLRKEAIQSALARLLVRRKVKYTEDLVALYQTPDVSKPRYVRVNSLKMDVDSVVLELGKQFTVSVSELVDKNLLFYFSRLICSPCREFTHKLVKAYHEIKAMHPDFEVIFVSFDNDEESFDQYNVEIPWLALPYDDKREALIKHTVKFNGIPHLTVVGPDGKIIFNEDKELVMLCGSDAYPFDEDQKKEMDSRLNEMSKEKELPGKAREKDNVDNAKYDVECQADNE